MYTLAMEDVDRLLTEKQAKQLKGLGCDKLAKIFVECPQPPEMGFCTDDEYKIEMLKHILDQYCITFADMKRS